MLFLVRLMATFVWLLRPIIADGKALSQMIVARTVGWNMPTRYLNTSFRYSALNWSSELLRTTTSETGWPDSVTYTEPDNGTGRGCNQSSLSVLDLV